MNEARDAVEEAAAQDIETKESENRRHDQPGRGKTLAPRKQRLCLKRRVPVLLGKIGLERVARRMQQVAAQAAHLAIEEHVFVHRVFAPSRMAAIEQPQIPVRIALAMSQPFAEKTVSPRHFVRVELRVLQR